jgi:hypothetical protein
MVEMQLTETRREELAALLSDESRLNAQFPKVADYLDMAPRLPGTGNQQLDATFDLRLVHYMTDLESTSVNPYWDIVEPLVFEHDGRLVVNGDNPNGSARLGYAEMVLQSAYAYAIPSPATLEWVADICDGRAVVELGAGRGYWAFQMANSGIEIDAYDVDPPDERANVSFMPTAGQADTWYPVRALNELAANAPNWPNQVLFLCWPPGWGDAMASRALAEFERAGGQCLIYIGEPQGGKTGDDAFFERLLERWKPVSKDAQFVSWWNVSDAATAWARR